VLALPLQLCLEEREVELIELAEISSRHWLDGPHSWFDLGTAIPHSTLRTQLLSLAEHTLGSRAESTSPSENTAPRSPLPL